MREIKFRGKTVNGNEWIYGMTISKGTIKRKANKFFMEVGEDRWKGLQDGSLGQYTGLKDKNGKEIYEGDIIFSNKCDGRAILHKVEYNEENAMFVAKPIQGLDFDFCQIHQSWIDKYGKDVIGNIYDNPELIK